MRGVQDRCDDAIALLYQDVPPELAAQALNRARIQCEAPDGVTVAAQSLAGHPNAEWRRAIDDKHRLSTASTRRRPS